MSDSTPGVRIFHGLGSSSAAALQPHDAPAWDEETEALYLKRVRGRAQEKAKEIMSLALVEAEQLRQKARDEGFAAGQAEAESQVQAEAQILIQTETQKISAFLSGLDQALHEEKKRIFATHKESLFQILCLSFEKTLGVVLDEGREKILTGLFEEAVGQLQTGGTVTVYVCPDDLDTATQLVSQAQEAQPGQPEYTLLPDPALELGGVRIESGDGLVDNSISSRLAQVRTILDGGAP